MGKTVHSSEHGSRVDWRGKQALVIGVCTSAHDASFLVPSLLCHFYIRYFSRLPQQWCRCDHATSQSAPQPTQSTQLVGPPYKLEPA